MVIAGGQTLKTELLQKNAGGIGPIKGDYYWKSAADLPGMKVHFKFKLCSILNQVHIIVMAYPRSITTAQSTLLVVKDVYKDQLSAHTTRLITGRIVSKKCRHHDMAIRR